MSLQFDGKVAVITGSGAGLGRCHALELARRGAKIVVNDLGGSVDGTGGSSEAAEKVVTEIKALGGEAIANGSSVTDSAGVKTLVEQTMDTFGRCDVLINNAGILRDKTFAKITMDDFQAVMDVHLMGTVKVTHAFWPIMREQNYGRILVTSSGSGLYGNFGQANYSAAKLAVVGFMHTLKLEGAKNNIKVNGLAPVALTRMTADLMPPETHDMLQPQYVTPGVVVLVSEEAPTGFVLCAGAGVFACAKMIETKGVYLGREGLTAETVLDNWDRITDETGAAPLFEVNKQTIKILELGK